MKKKSFLSSIMMLTLLCCLSLLLLAAQPLKTLNPQTKTPNLLGITTLTPSDRNGSFITKIEQDVPFSEISGAEVATVSGAIIAGGAEGHTLQGGDNNGSTTEASLLNQPKPNKTPTVGDVEAPDQQGVYIVGGSSALALNEVGHLGYPGDSFSSNTPESQFSVQGQKTNSPQDNITSTDIVYIGTLPGLSKNPDLQETPSGSSSSIVFLPDTMETPPAYRPLSECAAYARNNYTQQEIAVALTLLLTNKLNNPNWDSLQCYMDALSLGYKDCDVDDLECIYSANENKIHDAIGSPRVTRVEPTALVARPTPTEEPE